jgi:hypothetical protein
MEHASHRTVQTAIHAELAVVVLEEHDCIAVILQGRHGHILFDDSQTQLRGQLIDRDPWGSLGL